MYGKTIVILGLSLLLSLCGSGGGLVTAAKPTSPSYRTVTEIYDWGAGLSKLIVDLGVNVSRESVAKDTFRVQVVRTENRPNTRLLGEAAGDREVVRAYVADQAGQAVNNGRYVVLEMKVGPDVTLGSPLNFSLETNFNAWVSCEYTITQQKTIPAAAGTLSGLVIRNYAGGSRTLVDTFTMEKAAYEGITLNYASYTPPKDGKKKPLIIWLHGMGEGGTDPSLPIAANKADHFASQKLQAYFGGAYVLVPQTPTFWMDGFQGFGDGTSKYEKALMAMIRKYVAANRDIDTNRIYLGGDSNGGYMTMLLVRDYPEYFAAAFPTCEALRDSLITAADIQKMKNVPLWFTAAKTDKVVPPGEYVIATYRRLLEAGAPDVHLSLFEDVRDTTGLYKNADGTPYEYNGHWSWIYVYNNQCTATIDGQQLTLMEWLARQSLTTRRSN